MADLLDGIGKLKDTTRLQIDHFAFLPSSFLVTPFHHPKSPQIFVTKPHSGIIVLMLSYLLPIRWQGHTAN